jgi:hypothetical protein
MRRKIRGLSKEGCCRSKNVAAVHIEALTIVGRERHTGTGRAYGCNTSYEIQQLPSAYLGVKPSFTGPSHVHVQYSTNY